MKEIITDIKSLATLLMAGAALAACSGDDNIVEEQPANPTQHTYTMTIEASKGGGSDATTRALSIDGSGALNATWETSNEVKAYNYTQSSAFTGSLKPQSNDASATLTGTLTGNVAKDDVVYLRWPSVNANYTGQDGRLETIAQSYDYTTGVAKVTSIDDATIGAEDSSHGGPVLFTNDQAIVKFTLIDKDNGSPINATQLTIDAKVGGESRLIQSKTYPDAYTLGPITINRTSPANNVVYAALPFYSQAKFTFALTATDGTHTYTYEKTDVTMLNGRYYEVKVKMTRNRYPIALNGVTSDYIGSVVTTDGTVYATVADASAASKTAAGMIAYVSGIGQGLAIALADETSAMNWSTAITTAAAHPAVTGYSWKLPSQDEWKLMFSANGGSEGSYTVLNTALAAAGGDGSKLQDDIYWSSTPYDEVNAWRVHLSEGTTAWNTLLKGVNNQVRACLAFGYARGHALASSAVGEIVGSDGLAYYASDKNDLPLGVTAVAMIAYVGTASDCAHGLAIALADESGEKNYGAAGTACSGKAAVTGGTWRLPSEKDWQYMFIGCGSSESYSAPIVGTSKSYSGLASKLTTAQGEALAGYYWSSTEFRPGTDAWNVNFVSGNAGFNYYNENNELQVRACLAF